jgi:transposase
MDVMDDTQKDLMDVIQKNSIQEIRNRVLEEIEAKVQPCQFFTWHRDPKYINHPDSESGMYLADRDSKWRLNRKRENGIWYWKFCDEYIYSEEIEYGESWDRDPYNGYDEK